MPSRSIADTGRGRIYAATADAQGLRLFRDRQLVLAHNHRRALSKPALPRVTSDIAWGCHELRIAQAVAMRYLNTKGKMAWKATPGMLSRLADAEQEAIDDMEDWP
jgi:hypothetical protein